MAKVIRGISNKSGKFVSEEVVDDPTCLSKQDVLNIIGESNWKKFSKWMTGQGAPILADGNMGYFIQDVERFKEQYIDSNSYLTFEEIENTFKQMDKEKENKYNKTKVKK